MPVRPSKDPTEESLSHHGETGALMDLEVAEEEVDTEMMRGSPGESQGRQEEGEGGSDTEEGEDVIEARVAKGKKSPKDPTKRERERERRARAHTYAVP